MAKQENLTAKICNFFDGSKSCVVRFMLDGGESREEMQEEFGFQWKGASAVAFLSVFYVSLGMKIVPEYAETLKWVYEGAKSFFY